MSKYMIATGLTIGMLVIACVHAEEATLAETVDGFSIPDTPAFSVLGASPEQVTRPTTPAAFSLGVLQGLNADGNFQQGIAIETSPYMLFRGDDLQLREYQKEENWGIRAASRVQLSFATVKGAEEDKSLKASVGLRWLAIDTKDPRLDDALINCIGNSQRTILDLVQTQNRELLSEEEEVAKLEEAMKTIKSGPEGCRKDAVRRRWNRRTLELGAAPIWSSQTGDTSDFKSAGGATWISGTLPISEKGQFVLNVRKSWSVSKTDPNDSESSIEQDVLSAGARFRWGAPKLTFHLEAAYIEEEPDDLPDEDVFRYSVGTDFKLAKDLWLQLSFGTESGRVMSSDGSFVNAEFSWALNRGD